MGILLTATVCAHYLDFRVLAEGTTKKEIIRCLKRYITREVYRGLA